MRSGFVAYPMVGTDEGVWEVAGGVGRGSRGAGGGGEGAHPHLTQRVHSPLHCLSGHFCGGAPISGRFRRWVAPAARGGGSSVDGAGDEVGEARGATGSDVDSEGGGGGEVGDPCSTGGEVVGWA